MKKDQHTSWYAIAAVSKLTGVSCHALRVWERRHGFPRPERTESGHRRYSADQVGVLRWVASGLKEGRDLASLMDEARTRLLSESSGRAEGTAEGQSVSEMLVKSLLSGDSAAAEAFLDRETQGLAPADIVEQILEPAWVDAGDRLFRGLCGLEEERVSGEFLRRKLIVLLDGAKRRNSQPRGRILLSTLAGDRHEGGVQMVAFHLELAGWRAVILGTEVPIGTVIQAIGRFQPGAVGVSFILSRNIRKRFAELSRITEVPVFVGGRSVLNHQCLARRYGLIPLPGPARKMVDTMIARIESSQAAGELRNAVPGSDERRPPAKGDAVVVRNES